MGATKLGWKFSKIWNGIYWHDEPFFSHHWAVHNGHKDWIDKYRGPSLYSSKGSVDFSYFNNCFYLPMGAVSVGTIPGVLQNIRSFAGDMPIGSIAWENMGVSADEMNRICYTSERNAIFTKITKQEYFRITWDATKNGWIWNKGLKKP